MLSAVGGSSSVSISSSVRRTRGRLILVGSRSRVLLAFSASANAKACFGGSARNEFIKVRITHSTDDFHSADLGCVVRSCCLRSVSHCITVHGLVLHHPRTRITQLLLGGIRRWHLA